MTIQGSQNKENGDEYIHDDLMVDDDDDNTQYILRQCLSSVCAGPVNWNFIHALAERYPIGCVDKDTQKMYKELVRLFVLCNGCIDCTEHAQVMLIQYPINYSTRMDFTKSWMETHNRVNIRLHKQIISEHAFKNIYQPRYACYDFQHESVWMYLHALTLRVDCQSNNIEFSNNALTLINLVYQTSSMALVSPLLPNLQLQLMSSPSTSNTMPVSLFDQLYSFRQQKDLDTQFAIPKKQDIILCCTCSSTKFSQGLISFKIEDFNKDLLVPSQSPPSLSMKTPTSFIDNVMDNMSTLVLIVSFIVIIVWFICIKKKQN